METKQKQRQNSLKVHLKSWSMVWIPALKRCLCFAWRNPENLFFSVELVNNIYEQWLVITASLEDRAAVVFVSNKFMSSCVIFLFIAR